MDPVSSACSVAKIIGSCLSSGAQAADGGAGGSGMGMPGIAPQAHSNIEIGEVTCCSPVTFKRKNKSGNSSVKNRSRSNSTTAAPEHLKRASRIFADSISDLESGTTVPTRRAKVEIKIDDMDVSGLEELTDSKKLSLIGRLSASFKRASIHESPKSSPKASPASSKRNSVIFSPEVQKEERRRSLILLENLEKRLTLEIEALEEEERISEKQRAEAYADLSTDSESSSSSDESGIE